MNNNIESYIDELEEIAKKAISFKANMAIVVPHKLIAVVSRFRELDKEANWLAKKCSIYCDQCNKSTIRECPVVRHGNCDGNYWCIGEYEWRETARVESLYDK